MQLRLLELLMRLPFYNCHVFNHPTSLISFFLPGLEFVIHGCSNSRRTVGGVAMRKVAVIGAGAAGLVAARELCREGLKVVIFERNDKVGGTWVYDSNVESDPLGIDPCRSIVHSSLYESLRTNLPREIMGFRDYPFVVKDGMGRDPRRFPGHREVFFYLNDFAADFKLIELIRFQTEVVHVGMVEERRWEVKLQTRKSGIDGDGASFGVSDSEFFDAVVVCNGHFTEPIVAEIPGIDSWPGKQMHSHNYRVAESFRDQVVILIGSSVSAEDIARDIVNVAKEVHVASRSATGTLVEQLSYDNLWLHSMIESAHENGRVVFQDGSSTCADVILHCTGYKYYFPFLETNNIVTVDENRVGPLYKHIFPPLLAPGLSFIGLISKVLIFPLMELQSKWVAGVLSGRIALPSHDKMKAHVEAFYLELEAANVPKKSTHNIYLTQFEYADWLAAECGCFSLEEWRKQMFVETFKTHLGGRENYRDNWEDQHLVLQAEQDFLRVTLADVGNDICT